MSFPCIPDKWGINFRPGYDANMCDQQPRDHSQHAPVSKDPPFSSWLLMCLAGNYCDSDKSFPDPPLKFGQLLGQHWQINIEYRPKSVAT